MSDAANGLRPKPVAHIESQVSRKDNYLHVAGTIAISFAFKAKSPLQVLLSYLRKIIGRDDD